MFRACAWVLVLLSAHASAQQDERDQQSQTPVFTLKVYANLVQVPTLVLDHERQPLPPIEFKRFQVSLDSGQKFAPARVRLEGDDPLNLSILLDVRGSQRSLIAAFADAAAKMAAESLHSKDRVSIYAVDCNLVRSAQRVVADPDVMRRAVEAAIGAPGISEGKVRGRCPDHAMVWDSMVRVVQDMLDSPNRGVMLVFSRGGLPGKISWGDIHHFAGERGVAIFGMNDGTLPVYPEWGRDNAEPLRALCESTGGLVMNTDRTDLPKRLEQWVSLLRNRYIVEFPRPQQMEIGSHSIDVSIKRDDMAFVTLAGVSVSLPDPSETTDPHYLPSTAGADIPVGKRRPLSK